MAVELYTHTSELKLNDYIPGLGFVMSIDPVKTDGNEIEEDALWIGVKRGGHTIGKPYELASLAFLKYARPDTGNHPDHPPVEGGYRGEAFDISTTPGALPPIPVAPSVLGEAMLRDSVRTDGPRVLTRLPDESAERKRIPLCTGVIDYMPQALEAAISLLQDGDEPTTCEANDILFYLAERDYTALFCACLDALQDELCGPPTQCRSRSVPERWGAALIAVAQVSAYGNEKHNPGEPLHHARGKSMDHADCIARHTWDAGGFDGPMRHSACRAWRAGVMAQEAAEADGAPLARGARLP